MAKIDMSNYKYSPNWVSVKEFTITEDHIKLLKHMKVNWMPVKSEAPFIDFFQPYGSTCVDCDMTRILGMKPKLELRSGKKAFTDEQKQYLRKVHRETQIALQIFLCTGKMEPGKYRDTYFMKWEKVED